MRRTIATFILLVAACAAATAARAAAVTGSEAGSSPLGFGYCPPPVVPGCIAAGAALRSSRPALEACSRDVLRFTQTLGAYRACLTRESERAIGTGNTAIARFRCVAQGGTECR